MENPTINALQELYRVAETERRKSSALLQYVVDSNNAMNQLVQHIGQVDPDGLKTLAEQIAQDIANLQNLTKTLEPVEAPENNTNVYKMNTNVSENDTNV